MARQEQGRRDGGRPPKRGHRPGSKPGPASSSAPGKRAESRPGSPSQGRRDSAARKAGPGHRPAKPDRRYEAARKDAELESGKPQRLQKILAHAGLGSRRECEEYILQGRVTVDGKVVRELGTRVDPDAATIAVDGEKIRLERMVYFAVNKPKGYVSTNNDPAGRPRVIDLLPEVPERVYAVGRLDEESMGLMILTNDGELANRLAHPRFGVEKTYRALVAGTPGPDILSKLTEGIWLSDGKVRAKRARFVGSQGEATTIELVLAEGKKREIRRMLAKLGHKVMNLTRLAIGPVVLKGISPGEHRPLTRTEIDLLRKVAAGIEVAPPRASQPRNERRPAAPGKRPGVPGTAGEQRTPQAHNRTEAHGPRRDRPAPPTRPGPPSARPGSGKPVDRPPGKAMPGKKPPAKAMPGRPPSNRPASMPAPPGKRPGPPPGALPGGKRAMPAVKPPTAAPAPAAPGQPGKPEVTQARPARRIIGLAPKVAEEAGLSLSGRPPRKRPAPTRRPPRKAHGVERSPDDRKKS